MTAHAMHADTVGEPAIDDRDENFVPGWMALLVALLLIGVLAVGALVVRRVVEERAATDPAVVAIARYQDQVASNPADMGARLNLAYAYQQAERYDEAVKQYDRVLQTQPGDLAALYNEGVIAAARGDKAAAARWWKKVLGVDPTHVLAAKALGEQLASGGDYRGVLVVVGPAVEANPQMADLDYLMGLAYEKLGDRAKARERYRIALAYSPDLQEARTALDRLGGGTP
jgi:tetratricopeptide (TPR) repeat protein